MWRFDSKEAVLFLFSGMWEQIFIHILTHRDSHSYPTLTIFKKYDKISLFLQTEFAYFPDQTRVHISLEDWITSSLIRVYWKSLIYLGSSLFDV